MEYIESSYSTQSTATSIDAKKTTEQKWYKAQSGIIHQNFNLPATAIGSLIAFSAIALASEIVMG